MNRSSHYQLWPLLVLLAAFAGPPSARADALSAVQVLREGGCGGIAPAARPLHHNLSLDRVAEQWAAGRSLSVAAEGSGWRAESTSGLRVSGPDSSMLQLLRNSDCRMLTSQRLRDIGVYRRGLDSWLVLGSVAKASADSWTPVPTAAPAPPTGGDRATLRSAAAPELATRALQLVNAVRARGTRCGERLFTPAPPVTLSGTLAGVALGHAADMAEHNYFEHQDLAGQSPADRVRAVGYREKLVGENIAYGPGSVEEAVQGWLDSPDHCENIMDPRFAEMGIAFAAGRASRRGLYWVQVLAGPRT